ncbi:response regulator [Balneatrix alpica]|uniref:response regulator n=1 Tax=Balneatrix alpica TaxID=75684 RepID=UPI0027395362|nr:response regulator transcription factor [Balneatrix alpica]
MRLVLVEDDATIARFIAQGMQEQGWQVECFANGFEAWQFMRHGEFDLAILDIMLPGLDGLSLLQRLRGQGLRQPLLLLSARAQLEQRVEGLEAGADDYLIKPFALSELQARVQALWRRRLEQPLLSRLQLADLELDLVRKTVLRGGERIHLQPKELALLEYMLRNVGRVLSKTQILQQVYDLHFDPQTNVVDVLVCRLRSKIDRDHPLKLLHTLRGLGYVLREEEA